jgi:hypothetical protein
MLSKPINETNPSAYHGEQENLFDVLFQDSRGCLSGNGFNNIVKPEKLLF